MSRGEYSTEKVLKSQAKKRHTLTNNIIPWLLYVAIIGFMGIDLITVFQMTDAIFVESPLMGGLMALGIVLILDITPCAIGHFCQNDDKRLTAIIIFVIMMGAYVTIVFMQGSMRWNSRAETFSGYQSEMAMETEVNNEIQDGEYETTEAQNAATIMFAVLPVATSTLILYLSCAVSRERKIQQAEELATIEMNERLKLLDMCIEELDNDLRVDLVSYDEEMFLIMRKMIDHYGEIFKNYADQMLVLKVGTPEAVEYVMQKNNKEVKLEEKTI